MEEVSERLNTLERQMAEVRAALFLDDPNLVADLIGGPRCEQCRSLGVAYLLDGDERTGGMVCEQHVLPATLAGYAIERKMRAR